MQILSGEAAALIETTRLDVTKNIRLIKELCAGLKTKSRAHRAMLLLLAANAEVCGLANNANLKPESLTLKLDGLTKGYTVKDDVESLFISVKNAANFIASSFGKRIEKPSTRMLENAAALFVGLVALASTIAMSLVPLVRLTIKNDWDFDRLIRAVADLGLKHMEIAVMAITYLCGVVLLLDTALEIASKAYETMVRKPAEKRMKTAFLFGKILKVAEAGEEAGPSVVNKLFVAGAEFIEGTGKTA